MQTLLDRLKNLYPDSSSTTLRQWIRERRIFAGGRPILRANTLISEEVEITLEKGQKMAEEGVEILFEDNEIIVVNKPAGLLTVGTAFQKDKTLHAILKKRYRNQKVFPVHRLDREVSGILVFAYTELSKEFLKERFFHHDIDRIYTALVEGNVEPDSGTWESHLVQDANYHVHSASRGKKAITHFRVLKRQKKTTLLEIKLETGRKNQIRVHCKDAGHPIVGDSKYGATMNPYGRLCLHATHLAFSHPRSEKKLQFTNKPSYTA